MKEHETVRVTPTHIILYDGHEVYTVTAAFYNAVRLQVEESIPGLIHGEKYKSEWLCGNAFWKPLSNDEKRMAGRCIAHMVVTGVLPLRFADSRHEYPNWYRLNHH
jgi:hypothetical protein